MTILEAFKADVPENWGLKDSKLERRLLKRGLTPADTLTDDSEKYIELAFADLMMILANSVNISEGDYKFTIPSPKELRENASGIYTKHGESNPYVSTIIDASDLW